MINNFNSARLDNCNGCGSNGGGSGGGGGDSYRTLKPGSYHNPELGLISISYDGVNWITMADKNLGATEVWNVGDEITDANAGYYYQRGNIYGFNQDLTQYTKSRTRINARNYGPGNYYSSNIIRTYNDHRDNSNNSNLWGGGEDGKANQRGRYDTNFEDRQGPCPDGYHIPSAGKLSQLYGIMLNIYNTLNCTSYRFANAEYGFPFRNLTKYKSKMRPEMNDYIKLAPASGTRYSENWANPFDINSTNGNIRSSSGTDDISKYIGRNASKLCIGKTENFLSGKNYRTSLFNIRPFKNEPVVPDESWTPLYTIG